MYYTRGTFVLLLTISAVLNTADACTCMPSHPQEHYCRSDFVILATVKREFTHEYSRIYKVKIRKEFKMSEKAKMALKSGKLHTARHDSMCGVELELRKTYLITGRLNGLQPHIGLCGFTKPWSEISHRQRKGFRLLYHRGCDCQVIACRSTSCSLRNNTCAWNMHSQCQTDHGICLRNAKGKCKWTSSMALKNCLYDGQKKNTSPTTEAPIAEKHPYPYVLPEGRKELKEIKEEPARTEPNRYQRVGYYHYNKISN